MGDLEPEGLLPLLQQLLLSQKQQGDVEGVLSMIKATVDAECFSSSLSDKEWATGVATIFAALRVGMKSSIATGKWVRDRKGYAMTVHSCCKDLGQGRRTSILTRVMTFEAVSSLLTCIVSDMEADSVSLYVLLQVTNDLCCIVSYSEEMKSEFASMKSVALFGKIVSVCLEIAKNHENDLKCRLMALTSLKTVVDCSKEKCDSLCVVLPGLASTLANIACKSSSEHYRIIVSSIKILTRAICFSVADSVQSNEYDNSYSELNSSIQELYVVRNEKWKALTAANIMDMVRVLCSSLTLHRDQEVKSALLKSLYSVRCRCRKVFENSLDGYLLDLFLTLQTPSSVCSELMCKIREEDTSKFSAHLHEKLRELAERIPLNIRKKATDVDVLFCQLKSVLFCLKEDLCLLACGQAPTLCLLFSALGSSLCIDEQRLLISRSSTTNSSIDFVRALPFSSDVVISSVIPICGLLAVYGKIEVVELAISEMVSSEKGGRSSLAILITLILAEMETTADSYVLFTLIETCIEWLKGMVSSPHCRDDLIEHVIPALTKETSLTISLVSLIAVAFKHLAEESKQLKLLVNFLYQLLELYALPEWIVHDAVDCALLQIATTMGLSVSEFLHTHGSYIVHRVAISARSRSDRNRAPVVFRALLDKVDDSRLYSSVRHIIADLLFALDKFHQDFCILVMRSMLSFVMAIGRWFPDMKPVEMAESCTIENGSEELLETERKTLPPPVADVERVLLRTKHLMSSPHLPIRLLAMRVLHEGLYVLRNFDDALLPMVHQNWETLINRFSDKDLEVHQEAMKVVIQMVNVSKSFVYRRVRHQLWPILETWLTHDLHRYTTGTLTYKRRLLITRSIADIWIGIGALPADVHPVLSALSLISQQTTDIQLKNESEIACKRLNIYLQEQARTNVEVSC
uniref:TELO2-interacting protein 1 homolog n=1 Tax=Haemonchus contortus TaxID=6289 RepID=A0A7I4YHA0_HAECO